MTCWRNVSRGNSPSICEISTNGESHIGCSATTSTAVNAPDLVQQIVPR